MIKWTSSGAVATPTTVQIRVQRSYPGRIRAGAPVPTRSMSPEEVATNIQHFTAGLRAPRSIPCDGLVLSGVGVANRSDTPDAIAQARAEGIENIVLHVGVEDLDSFSAQLFLHTVDTLVVPVQPDSGTLTTSARAISAAREAGLRVAAVTGLTPSALPSLTAVARVLAAARPAAMTFTYPFPINGNEAADAPLPHRAVTALRPALDILDAAHVPTIIKGLPACHLGSDAHRLGKTGNRWYVDADHQCDEALLFFPDVVAFHKDEVCRFCPADSACDGFFATYLRRAGFPPLRPLDAQGF
jgi:hypothetical protein